LVPEVVWCGTGVAARCLPGPHPTISPVLTGRPDASPQPVPDLPGVVPGHAAIRGGGRWPPEDPSDPA